MPQRDGLNSKVGVHMGNLTLSGATPASTDWFDTRGFDKVTMLAIANTITDAGTASGFSFEVEESDTTADADATAVDDDQLVGLESDLTETTDGNDDTLIGGIGYIGSKRYVRLTATGTTNTDADVTVLGIGEAASYEPRTFVGTSVAAT